MVNMSKRYINFLLFTIKNRSTKFGKNVNISHKTQVGKNCTIGCFSRLSKDVSLGDNVKIGEYTDLHKLDIGLNSTVESGVKIVGAGKGRIKIGKECYIGINNILDASDNITIGDFVHIAGPSTALWCHSSVDMCLNSIPLNDV